MGEGFAGVGRWLGRVGGVLRGQGAMCALVLWNVMAAAQGDNVRAWQSYSTLVERCLLYVNRMGETGAVLLLQQLPLSVVLGRAVQVAVV